MPTYTFIDKSTGKEETHVMSFSEHEKFCKKNKHLEQVIKAAGIGDPIRLGRKKPDPGFRSLLKDMKKGNKNSTINSW